MNRILRISALVPHICGKPLLATKQALLLPICGYKRHVKPTLRELYKRRVAAGPEPLRPRSAWANWNYQAELFAFGKRLDEDFNEDALRTAFTHKSYVEKELEKRQELEIGEDTVALSLEDNTELAYNGHSITSRYIEAYLHSVFPKFPERGIFALRDYLLSEDVLLNISSNLGIKDLILSKEFPPSTQTLIKTLMAVIGALEKSQGAERSHLFVQDFILTQLKGKELSDLVEIVNPMGMLAEILENEKRGLPEPRLIWKSGSATVTAAYVVGIYSDKELIGQSPGETTIIAEELAARDALRKYFGLLDNMAGLKFGEEGHKLTINC